MPGQATKLQYRSAARSHIGLVRSRNEDAVLERPAIGLWAVADGAGGHDFGDHASTRIVEALAEIMAGEAFPDEIKRRLAGVHRELRHMAAETSRSAIASTVVAVAIRAQRFHCVWAGDSRLYLLRDGTLKQLNHDHSYVQRLVDQGIISQKSADTHPLANLVTNLVGGTENLLLEEVGDVLETQDRLLLCSDGLNRAVSDSAIADILGRHQPAEAADSLIRSALEGGGRDNVSVVVIGVSAEPDQRPRSPLTR